MTERESDEGFAWGLTPGGGGMPAPDDRAAEERAAQEPPALVEPPAPVEPPALVEPPARAIEPDPTRAITQPVDVTEPVEQKPADEAPEPAPETAVAAAVEPAQPEPAQLEPAALEPVGALGALFGDDRFRDYDDEPAAATPSVRRSAGPRSRNPRTQRTMIAVVGGLVAALALFALFLLGTRLPAALATADVTPTPTVTRTATPTPTPTATAGALPAGKHVWDALRGGECLDPYAGPWSETFTVVDCAVAHPAQVVVRGTFPASPVFPGTEALQAQLSLLCTAPGVLNLAAAGAYADAQVQGSYPATAQQWDAGEHDYWCFVSRTSGQPLTGSVAAP